MGSIQEYESSNAKLREEIEKAYRQIDFFDKIICRYKEDYESGFTRTSLREKSFIEKIFPQL